MELFEVIQKRHSYRGAFTATAVKRDDLIKIVEAGIAAPSGCNAQTTSFVIVNDPAAVGQIRSLHPRSKAMQTAAAYIACITDRSPAAVYEGFSFQVEDCSAAVENMLLAITALGYACVWVDGWLRVNGNDKKISEILVVPDNKLVRIILPIGIPVEQHNQPARLPFDKRAFF
jgi:nitroreductase